MTAVLATILKAEGKLDEAIVLWERIEKNAESANSATGHLAAIYLERKQFDKALKCYEKLVKSDPQNKGFQQGLKEAQAGLAQKTNG